MTIKMDSSEVRARVIALLKFWLEGNGTAKRTRIAEERKRDKHAAKVVLEAFEGLATGDLHSVFRPTKTKKKGKKPGAAQKIRFKAVGYTELLRLMGYKPERARSIVAKELNRSPDTIKTWQNQFKELAGGSDPLSFIPDAYQAYVDGKLPGHEALKLDVLKKMMALDKMAYKRAMAKKQG